MDYSINEIDLFLATDQTIFDQTILVGAGEGTPNLLCWLSNTNFTHYIAKIKGDASSKIIYKVDKVENKKKKFNSIYFDDGAFNIVIVIENLLDNNKYVIKFTLYNDIDNKFWKLFTYQINYVKYKEILGKALANLLYYGDNVQKVEGPDKEHSSKTEEKSTENEVCEQYKLIPEGKKIGFEIYKYYDGRLDSIEEKIIILGKFISLLIYFQNINQDVYNKESIYIYDLHPKNIAIEKSRDPNICFIDYEKKLCKFSSKFNKSYFPREITFSILNSTCIKKLYFVLFKLYDISVIRNIYEQAILMQGTFNKDRLKDFEIKTHRIIRNKLLNTSELLPINELGNYVDGKYYSYGLTSYNLYFDKFNYQSLVDYILHLFYKVNIQTDEMKFGMWQFSVMDTVGYEDNKIKFKKYKGLSPYVFSAVDIFSCFNSLNDILILKKIIYGKFNSDILHDQKVQPYNKPVFDINDDIKEDPILNQFLNSTIFCNVLERGAFAPDYEHSAHIILIFESFYKHFGAGFTNIFDLHKTNIDSNIGTDYVMHFLNGNYEELFKNEFNLTHIGRDVIDFCINNNILDGEVTIFNLSYKKWCLISVIEQELDRWENRSKENIKVPPHNSTLKQSYYKYQLIKDKGTHIYMKCKKWELIDGSLDIYQDTEEYIEAQNKKLYVEYISDEQKYLDSLLIRRYIKLIVFCIKLKNIPSDFILKLLTDPQTILTLPEELNNIKSQLLILITNKEELLQIHREYIEDKSSICKLQHPDFETVIQLRTSILDKEYPPDKLKQIHEEKTIPYNKWYEHKLDETTSDKLHEHKLDELHTETDGTTSDIWYDQKPYNKSKESSKLLESKSFIQELLENFKYNMSSIFDLPPPKVKSPHKVKSPPKVKSPTKVKSQYDTTESLYDTESYLPKLTPKIAKSLSKAKSNSDEKYEEKKSANIRKEKRKQKGRFAEAYYKYLKYKDKYLKLKALLNL